MAKQIKITNAEVITFYQSDDYLKEIETEKGTIMSFQVKTRINDRVENSPLVFERCSFFADNTDAIEMIRNLVKPGNILELRGFASRNKGKDKEGNDTWYDGFNVREINAINVANIEDQPAQEIADEDDLPF